RERLELTVLDDPESVAEAVRLARLDHETFANAPGRYRALYIEGENLSPLYPLYQRRAEATGGAPEPPPEEPPKPEEPATTSEEDEIGRASCRERGEGGG